MKTTIGKEKKKAWVLFSKYIRQRDALKTTGTLTEARCITCDRLYPIKELQAGHFLPGRHNGVLFDERNCHAQCYGCNVPMKSNPVKYFRKMQEMYGEEVIKELEELDKRVVQLKIFHYQMMIDQYKLILETMKGVAQ